MSPDLETFKSLGTRNRFYMLTKLADIAGLELDVEDLARQVAENSIYTLVSEDAEKQFTEEYEYLLGEHDPRKFSEIRDARLAHAFAWRGRNAA
jgi:hypothetical protein